MKVGFLSVIVVVILLAGGVFLLVNKPENTTFTVTRGVDGMIVASSTTVASSAPEVISSGGGDIENQQPLQNPPKVVKAIYATSWTASSQSRMNELIKLINETELNAIVIDIKDYSGYITYDIQNAEVEKYKAKELRTPRINALIKQLHENGIYVIARTTVFQDPVLAKARPDLAIKSASSGGTWKDRKGISWVDSSSKEVWDYNIAIAKDASERGFDEINFDYIRFASDGNLSDMVFSSYNPVNGPKHTVIKKFFQHLHSELHNVKISADLFGLTTVNSDDLGIGQIIEDAYETFDYVAPMVYPSHYASGFLGYKNPALYPYEVVNYSMVRAVARLQKLAEIPGSATTSTPPKIDEQKLSQLAKLRPWLQDFDLGADYDAAKVRAQIQAVSDAGLNSGWMLWDPRNVYTRGALRDADAHE